MLIVKRAFPKPNFRSFLVNGIPRQHGCQAVSGNFVSSDFFLDASYIPQHQIVARLRKVNREKTYSHPQFPDIFGEWCTS